jgi:uncharacterized protein
LQRVTRERHQTDAVAGPPSSRGDGPVRTCVACRRVRPRGELARLARTPDGVRYDRRRRAPGRGANLCPDPVCIDTASDRGAARLRRALRGAPADQIHAALAELRREIDEPRHQTTLPGDRGGQALAEGAVRSSRT